MSNQFNFDDALGEIISSPRARKLAQSTLESLNVDKMSLAQLKSYSVEVFESLMGSELTEDERQSAMAINLYVSQKSNELGGVNPNLMANDERGMEQAHENLKHNLSAELQEARESGNVVWQEQVQRQIDNVSNVDLVRNGEQPVLHFDSEADRERYEANAGNATVVKTSEEHLASMMNGSTGREDI